MKNLIMLISFIFWLVTTSGCLYLHDQQRQSDAEAAKEGFEVAIQDGAITRILSTYSAHQLLDDELVRRMEISAKPSRTTPKTDF